jgi:hypothetical protein
MITSTPMIANEIAQNPSLLVLVGDPQIVAASRLRVKPLSISPQKLFSEFF